MTVDNIAEGILKLRKAVKAAHKANKTTVTIPWETAVEVLEDYDDLLKDYDEYGDFEGDEAVGYPVSPRDTGMYDD